MVNELVAKMGTVLTVKEVTPVGIDGQYHAMLRWKSLVSETVSKGLWGENDALPPQVSGLLMLSLTEARTVEFVSHGASAHQLVNMYTPFPATGLYATVIDVPLKSLYACPHML